MTDASPLRCEDCGTTAAVRTYDDPETDEPVALCPGCAIALVTGLVHGLAKRLAAGKKHKE